MCVRVDVRIKLKHHAKTCAATTITATNTAAAATSIVHVTELEHTHPRWLGYHLLHDIINLMMFPIPTAALN